MSRPGLTWFLWVSFTMPTCLHSQEVEEDPQGAGKAPEMWLTALAANPVHLFNKNSILRGTREHECTTEMRKGWKGGDKGSFQQHRAL